MTTSVDTEALDVLLEWAMCHPDTDWNNPDGEIERALADLWADRHDCYLCELCTLPSSAKYRAGQGDMVVCTTHANALESGEWNGEEWEVEPLPGA